MSQKDYQRSQIIKKIQKEMLEEVESSDKYILLVNDKFKQIIRAVQTKSACRRILLQQRLLLENRREQGYLDTHNFFKLRRKVERNLLTLENSYFQWDDPSFYSYMKQSSLFSTLNNDQFAQLMCESYEGHIQKDQYLVQINENNNYIYIIIEGSMLEYHGNYKKVLGIGHITCYANMIQKTNDSLVSVQALSYSIFYKISKDVIKKLMRENPLFEQMIFKNSLFLLDRIQSSKNLMQENELMEFLNCHCTFIKSEKGKVFNIEKGGYLYNGEIQTIIPKEDLLNTNCERFKDFCYILPNLRQFCCVANGHLIIFNEEIKLDTQNIQQIDEQEKVLEEQYNTIYEKH